jgi:hypothetical protein
MSTTKEELEIFIAKQIRKSGFPLEIFSSLKLKKAGWNVTPHLLFYNELKNSYNELDIYASKLSKRQGFVGSHFMVLEVLVIECKKQETVPWVFFEQEQPTSSFLTLAVVPPDSCVLFEKSFKNHYYFNKKPCSYHFPAFVSSGKPDVILDAINHVLDALNYIRTMATNLMGNYHIRNEQIFYPVVVLDGKLFSAKIEADDTVTATESNHLQLQVERALKEPLMTEMSNTQITWSISDTYIVDIVRKDFLEEFLKNFP